MLVKPGFLFSAKVRDFSPTGVALIGSTGDYWQSSIDFETFVNTSE